MPPAKASKRLLMSCSPPEESIPVRPGAGAGAQAQPNCKCYFDEGRRKPCITAPLSPGQQPYGLAAPQLLRGSTSGNARARCCG